IKPAVFSPAVASRWRCSIGRRTSACTPLMKARPCCKEYLSSSDTVSRAWRTDSGKGAFMGVLRGTPFDGRVGDGSRRRLCQKSMQDIATGAFVFVPCLPLFLKESFLKWPDHEQS